ncbi:hypothetical protein [Sandaracinus amylolyticus]|uniref:Uncharacterized protein n=1 Tax=Sandaracinus amylolyticus TaxID=927083 RepID=A0A0F6YIR0_9BACT|nr:hypothetical protein [Sandaracinus amylolyticus]AKF06057.1 hypothetical protein DB32_003206 [Sandaracinus amylolyticus]
MLPTPAAPAPSPSRGRSFPVRQKQLREQLSLPGHLHAAENHPDLPEALRPVLRALRVVVADRTAIDALPVGDVSTHEALATIGWSAREKSPTLYKNIVRDERGEVVAHLSAHETSALLAAAGVIEAA